MAHHSSSRLSSLSCSTMARAIRAWSNCGHQFFFIFSSLESHYSCRYACLFVCLFLFLFPTTPTELKTYPEPIQSRWRPNSPPVTPGSPLTCGTSNQAWRHPLQWCTSWFLLHRGSYTAHLMHYCIPGLRQNSPKAPSWKNLDPHCGLRTYPPFHVSPLFLFPFQCALSFPLLSQYNTSLYVWLTHVPSNGRVILWCTSPCAWHILKREAIEYWTLACLILLPCSTSFLSEDMSDLTYYSTIDCK
jgi:hypothetical protein